MESLDKTTVSRATAEGEQSQSLLEGKSGFEG